MAEHAYDGGDTQLHQGSSVGGEDDSDPVERIRGVRTHNAKQWNLRRREILKFILIMINRDVLPGSKLRR